MNSTNEDTIVTHVFDLKCHVHKKYVTFEHLFTFQFQFTQ